MASAEAGPFLQHLRDERDGVALYTALAEAERDPRLAEVYRRLAAVEQRHADVWAERARGVGVAVPPHRPSWRTRTFIWLIRRFGPGLVLPSVASLERVDSHRYDVTPEAGAMSRDERSHARLLRQISGGVRGGIEGGVLGLIEGRHRAAGGNALRAAVLGANDGLVSNLSLVMGVAGAELPGRAILITGLAGLLAGAFSMALGEWLSVQSSRELVEHQIGTERAELEAAPDEEAEELGLIYRAKGLDEAQARRLAAQIMADRATALDTLAREELGVDPGTLGGSAWEAALSSLVLFAVGAIVPVSPFLFASGSTAIVASLAVSALGLFAIGAAITLFTGRGVLSSGMRQVIFGLVASAITFGIGRLIGVNIGG